MSFSFCESVPFADADTTAAPRNLMLCCSSASLGFSIDAFHKTYVWFDVKS